ncbi:Myb-like DNA-binding domain containing protein [Trichomonas vaginalis G3]|uniref:Myb-like DNA-binding domain containing protein n=1 Tax=Trichomonas vaginalis (strain ATCC PRA-98 / G3) TaxID=412133 RepID=A2DUL8_TRIV3|nr:RNA polymerase II transcription regulator recruiting protein [Trichomonas vaginalis G3]EAY15909.1 Myb-like DNA-binding domain containing protein [Trichomonas vaginalis G3]KAI5506630.1 RNA polymerase II transcription regulator recruiting protein [Trichomonas vaginalis G3]|eukprot:XP_001328132.1 Myb-like DNA-binding domain containing protein [Trichomonas vaginalis G3]
MTELDSPPPKTARQRSARFTEAEDNILKDLVKDNKKRTWKEIATFLPGRTACQCRDRYNQYLFKQVIVKPWTNEEDEIIVEKYRLFGPHWVKISEFLPGRSGNNIKNRWNSALQKYHGISHEMPKQKRRSKKVKWGEVEERKEDPIQITYPLIPTTPNIIEPTNYSDIIPKAFSKPNVIDLDFSIEYKKIFC